MSNVSPNPKSRTRLGFKLLPLLFTTILEKEIKGRSVRPKYFHYNTNIICPSHYVGIYTTDAKATMGKSADSGTKLY